MCVHGLEAGENAGEEGFDTRRCGTGVREQGGDGGCWFRVDSVDADSEDDLVVAVRVNALREDASYFDIGGGISRLGRIKSIYHADIRGMLGDPQWEFHLQISLGHFSFTGSLS